MVYIYFCRIKKLKIILIKDSKNRVLLLFSSTCDIGKNIIAKKWRIIIINQLLYFIGDILETISCVIGSKGSNGNIYLLVLQNSMQNGRIMLTRVPLKPYSTTQANRPSFKTLTSLATRARTA